MTDDQFETLDQLYFVTSFTKLLGALDFEEKKLIEILKELINKGYVSAFQDVDTQSPVKSLEDSKITKYFYLATKKGLFAHNTL